MPWLLSPLTFQDDDVLARPATLPATPAEMRVAEHLVRRILDSSPEEVVEVPTRGQVSLMPCILIPSSLFACIAPLLSAFKAGDDSTTNLHTALDMYKEQIDELQLKYAV